MVTVRYSKRKAVVTLVISSLVAGGAGWAATRPLDRNDRLAAASVAVVAVIVAVQTIRRRFNQEPVVVISEEGFHDRRLKSGVVPWTEVRDVTVIRVRRQPFVSLHLHHPEGYLQNYSELARTLGKLESAVGLGDLPVGCAGLDHSADQIAAECLLHLIR